jgi:hypothetical protein
MFYTCICGFDRYSISVARRGSVEILDGFIGAKR